MVPFYVIRGNQYARMSNNFYTQFIEIKNLYEQTSAVNDIFDQDTQLNLLALQYAYRRQMDEAAIAAVIFQALAIEAYVNLLGIDVLGEAQYYTYCYDKKKKLERASTKVKLQIISGIIGKHLPDSLLCDIDALMDKRNNLVHQKPKATWVGVKAYNYEKPEENYQDINSFIEESMMAQKNIDREVQLYEELQEAIKTIRETDTELIEEFQKAIKEYSVLDETKGKM